MNKVVTFAQGQAEIAKLAKYFETNQEAFCAEGVKEADVRQSLIDPLFQALGWDVHNDWSPTAPQYREVVPEPSLDMEDEEKKKTPDYAFRVGTQPRFFAEAKKCAESIRQEKWAFQIVGYGYNARLPVSILTNFMELSVFDCTTRPTISEKPTRRCFLQLGFQEYPERWRELWDVYSREAVLSGAFDKIAESKRKRGTSQVDQDFLKELEGWREVLARNMALRNKLSADVLNHVVQLTINRIVFLRMSEDRGLEPFEQLLKLTSRGRIYTRFMDEICRSADGKYNSGLFHFDNEPGVSETPDTITPSLAVDDAVFGPILKKLYWVHNSPYNFRILPVEILGTVYERFLGKVIHVANHRAKVQLKPELRKANGAYYTPAYIVDYITDRTVGQKITGRSPMQLAGLKNGKQPFRVLDIACGSGSFLLGAYQCLLDHCLKWYVEHDPKRHKQAVYRDPRNKHWRLTIHEKKRILTTHVFGVDIDRQAVEVTKLSLLLKVLEGETDQSVHLGFLPFRDRALPNLADNIKCGNSLIAPDYFSGRLMIGEEEAGRIRQFDWNLEFAAAMTAGGFDCVIGNPPYIDSELMSKYYPDERKYCTSHYRAAIGNWDEFCVFIEKALELCKAGGLHSFIVPNKLASAEYAAGARTVIAGNRLLSFRDYSRISVFPVSVYPVVYVAGKRPSQRNASVVYERMGLSEVGGIVVAGTKKLPLAKTFGTGKSPWTISEVSGTLALVRKLSKGFPRLKSVAKVCGAATVAEAYILGPLISDKRKPGKGDIRLVNSGTIDRYLSLWGIENCRYLGKSFHYPVILSNKLRNVPETRLQQARKPKLIVAGMTRRLECLSDMTGGVLAGKSTSIVFPPFDVRYLLGIMNSRLIDFYYRTVYGGNALQGGYLRIGPPQLRELPIRVIDEGNAKDTQSMAKMLKLVDTMVSVQGQLAQSKSEPHRRALEHRIDALDAEIDAHVYGLYGLTADEITLIEEAATT